MYYLTFVLLFLAITTAIVFMFKPKFTGWLAAYIVVAFLLSLFVVSAAKPADATTPDSWHNCYKLHISHDTPGWQTRWESNAFNYEMPVGMMSKTFDIGPDFQDKVVWTVTFFRFDKNGVLWFFTGAGASQNESDAKKRTTVSERHKSCESTSTTVESTTSTSTSSPSTTTSTTSTPDSTTTSVVNTTTTMESTTTSTTLFQSTTSVPLVTTPTTKVTVDSPKSSPTTESVENNTPRNLDTCEVGLVKIGETVEGVAICAAIEESG